MVRDLRNAADEEAPLIIDRKRRCKKLLRLLARLARDARCHRDKNDHRQKTAADLPCRATFVSHRILLRSC